MSTDPTRQFPDRMTWSVNPLHVGIGLFARWSVIDKFGKNTDIDASFEPVSLGGSAILLDVAETLDIVSTSTSDDLAGVGAQKITIQGLDENFAEQTLEVDMDGTTPVTTTGTTWLRFNRARVTQAGTGDTNIGQITISATDTPTANLLILALEGQTQTAQFTIPAAKTGYLEGVFLAGTSNTLMTGQLQVKPFGEGWQTKHEIISLRTHVPQDLSGSGAIPEKSDIRWIAKAAQVNSEVTAGFKVLLRDN